MAERSNATVLKTVEVQASLGSNPSPSATIEQDFSLPLLCKLPAACAFLGVSPCHER